MSNNWSLQLARRLTVLVVLGTTPAFAQELDLRLRQGFNSNVFETGAAAFNRPAAGHFTRFRIEFESPGSNRGTSVILRPRAHFQWYPQISSGNELAGSLRLRIRNVWRTPDSKKRRATVDLDLFGGYERALFLNRSLREELRDETFNASLGFEELPGRAEGRVQLSARVRASKSWNLKIGAFGFVRNYADRNHPLLPNYDKLDARELGGFVEASWEFARRVVLGVNTSLRRRAYPNRNARTSLGTEISGVNRRYLYWDGETSVEFSGQAVQNNAHVSFRRRADIFDGYYSYDQWQIGDRVTFAVARVVDLRLGYSYGQRAYDLFAPVGVPTFNHYHEARADLGFRLFRSWWLILGSRYDRTVSNDPVLDYEQVAVFAEMRLGR